MTISNSVIIPTRHGKMRGLSTFGIVYVYIQIDRGQKNKQNKQTKRSISSHMFCRAMDSRRSVIDGNEDTDVEGCRINRETGDSGHYLIFKII